jgi:hypothetical protein
MQTLCKIVFLVHPPLTKRVQKGAHNILDGGADHYAIVAQLSVCLKV